MPAEVEVPPTTWERLQQYQVDKEHFRFIVRKQRQCFAYYVDFHRCNELMGKDYKPCKFFQNVYKDFCPGFWVEKWDELIEEGRFPAKFDR
uniref:Cytochrome c oxidase subunit n=1 Tax=Heterorhabditis bacteriophora TaxID=37862 RepID=A0A1I7XD55_HETBA